MVSSLSACQELKFARTRTSAGTRPPSRDRTPDHCLLADARFRSRRMDPAELDVASGRRRAVQAVAAVLLMVTRETWTRQPGPLTPQRFADHLLVRVGSRRRRTFGAPVRPPRRAHGRRGRLDRRCGCVSGCPLARARGSSPRSMRRLSRSTPAPVARRRYRLRHWRAARCGGMTVDGARLAAGLRACVGAPAALGRVERIGEADPDIRRAIAAIVAAENRSDAEARMGRCRDYRCHVPGAAGGSRGRRCHRDAARLYVRRS